MVQPRTLVVVLAGGAGSRLELMTQTRAVLLHGAIVRNGARVVRAVLDQGAEVATGVTVGGEGEISLVGRGEKVTADLPAGGRQPVRDED